MDCNKAYSACLDTFWELATFGGGGGGGGVLLGVIRSQKLLTLLSGGRNFRVVATIGTLQYYIYHD